jgi:hypothetical protein
MLVVCLSASALADLSLRYSTWKPMLEVDEDLAALAHVSGLPTRQQVTCRSRAVTA